MSVFDFSDAFHIVEPMLDGTALTAWIVAPIYIAGYSVVLFIIELVRKYQNKNKKEKITIIIRFNRVLFIS